MSHDFLSAEDLQDTLRQSSIKEPKPASFIVALVKQSDAKNTLLVSQIGNTEWIEIPTKMVEKTKIVGTAECGTEAYPVALIFLAPTDDPFGKVAYKLLEQLGTAARSAEDGPCDCKQPNDTAPSVQRARNVNLGVGGLGRFGLGLLKCRVIFRCYPCTRCIPWTSICWDSTCCDLVGVDCSIG